MVRGQAPPAFGVSFLDLISCALGGVLVLYALAEPPRETSHSGSLSFLQVQVANQQPVMTGVRVTTADGQTYSSWADSSGVRWIVQPGRTLGLFTFPASSISRVELVALDPDKIDLPAAIDVMLQTSGGVEAKSSLLRPALYRYAWTP